MSITETRDEKYPNKSHLKLQRKALKFYNKVEIALLSFNKQNEQIALQTIPFSNDNQTLFIEITSLAMFAWT